MHLLLLYVNLDLVATFYLINPLLSHLILVLFYLKLLGHIYQTCSFSSEEVIQILAMLINLEYQILWIFLQVNLLIFVLGTVVSNLPFLQICIQQTICQLNLNTFVIQEGHQEVDTIKLLLNECILWLEYQKLWQDQNQQFWERYLLK